MCLRLIEHPVEMGRPKKADQTKPSLQRRSRSVSNNRSTTQDKSSKKGSEKERIVDKYIYVSIDGKIMHIPVRDILEDPDELKVILKKSNYFNILLLLYLNYNCLFRKGKRLK